METIQVVEREPSIASIKTMATALEAEGPVTIDSTPASKHSSSKHEEELVENLEKSSVLFEEDKIPDGGLKAWLVILGVFMVQFTAFGTASSW